GAARADQPGPCGTLFIVEISRDADGRVGEPRGLDARGFKSGMKRSAQQQSQKDNKKSPSAHSIRSLPRLRRRLIQQRAQEGNAIIRSMFRLWHIAPRDAWPGGRAGAVSDPTILSCRYLRDSEAGAAATANACERRDWDSGLAHVRAK